MTFGKTFRSVITCIKFHHIAILIVVRKSCGQTHTTFGQRRQEVVITIYIGVVLVNVKQGHTTNCMIAKAAVIVQVCLEIVPAVAVCVEVIVQYILLRVCNRFYRHVVPTIGSGVGSIVGKLVTVVVLHPVFVVDGVVFEREQRFER